MRTTWKPFSNKTKSLTFLLLLTYFICIGFSQFSFALTPQEIINEVGIAGKGSVDAQFNLGLWYYKGTELPQDYKEAIKWFQLAAEQGDAAAQLFLGSMYHKAEGVPQDYNKAIKWYRLSAAQGNAHAQKFLKLAEHQLKEEVGAKAGINVSGYDFQDALDASRKGDFQKAYKLWLSLAEQGNAVAQFNLGAIYATGEGVPQDYKQAVKWLQLASEQGVVRAQLNLGKIYEKGKKGVPQDYKEAIKWYTKAAEQGHIEAQYILGTLYRDGLGVLQDYALAHMWFNLCGSSGDRDCVKNRNIVEEKMSPSQIDKAQEMARNWKPTSN